MSGEPARAGARGHRGWWLVALLFAALYLLRAGGEAASFALAHPGDFSHYHRALAALWAGESPFRDPFANQTPALLAALLPLGGLSLAAARLLWFALGHLLLAAAGVGIWRWLGGGPLAAAAVAAAWAAGGTAAENLAIGQIHPLLLLLLVAALAALARRPPEPSLAALSLGTAAALKLFPALWIAALAGRGRRRHLLLALGTAALLLLLPALALRLLVPAPHAPASVAYWAGAAHPLNVSLPAGLLRVADLALAGRDGRWGAWLAANDPAAPPPATAALALSLAAAAALGGLALWHLLGRHRSPAARLVALASLSVVFSPIGWYHYQLFHLPALALTLHAAARSAPGPRGAARAASWLLLAAASAHVPLAIGHLALAGDAALLPVLACTLLPPAWGLLLAFRAARAAEEAA